MQCLACCWWLRRCSHRQLQCINVLKASIVSFYLARLWLRVYEQSQSTSVCNNRRVCATYPSFPVWASCCSRSLPAGWLSTSNTCVTLQLRNMRLGSPSDMSRFGAYCIVGLSLVRMIGVWATMGVCVVHWWCGSVVSLRGRLQPACLSCKLHHQLLHSLIGVSSKRFIAALLPPVLLFHACLLSSVVLRCVVPRFYLAVTIHLW